MVNQNSHLDLLTCTFCLFFFCMMGELLIAFSKNPLTFLLWSTEWYYLNNKTEQEFFNLDPSLPCSFLARYSEALEVSLRSQGNSWIGLYLWFNEVHGMVIVSLKLFQIKNKNVKTIDSFFLSNRLKLLVF